MLPEAGSVLGVDVGWSQRHGSTAFCRLDWNATSVRWSIARFNGDPGARVTNTRVLIGGRLLLAAAFDGRLRGDFAVIGRTRVGERALSVKHIADRISQPGFSSSKVGRDLNLNANQLACVVLKHGTVERAQHTHPIHELAIAEAFPTTFLGLMLANPNRGERKGRSDRYYSEAASSGVLNRLLSHYLPRRVLAEQFASVSDHDEQAAVVCALTALGVVTNDYVAAGDSDGWIILPPRGFVAHWALTTLLGGFGIVTAQ